MHLWKNTKCIDYNVFSCCHSIPLPELWAWFQARYTSRITQAKVNSKKGCLKTSFLVDTGKTGTVHSQEVGLSLGWETKKPVQLNTALKSELFKACELFVAEISHNGAHNLQYISSSQAHNLQYIHVSSPQTLHFHPVWSGPFMKARCILWSTQGRSLLTAKAVKKKRDHKMSLDAIIYNFRTSHHTRLAF